MGKGLHKVFSTVVKEISQEMTALVESGSEVSHFIPESRHFAEVKKLSKNIKKPWLKANLKEMKNLINNQNFLIEDQNEGEPVTLYMDVYKANIQSDGSLDKLKLRILVRRCLHKLFSMVVKEILQELTPLGEYGSEVSHFIPEPRNFDEVTKLS